MANVLNRDFQIHKDVNGIPTYLKTKLVPGDLVSLLPLIEQTFTVPNSANLVIFSKDSGNTVYCLIDDGSGSIVLPGAGASISDSMIDINVIGVSVKGGDIIHLMSPVATNIKINYCYDRTLQ